MGRRKPQNGTIYETIVNGEVYWMQYIKPEDSYTWDPSGAAFYVAPTPVRHVPGEDVCARWQQLQRDAYLVYFYRPDLKRHEKAGTLRPIAVCPPAPSALELYGKLAQPAHDKQWRVIGWYISDRRISYVPQERVTRLTDEQKAYPRRSLLTIAWIRGYLAAGYRPELDAVELGSTDFSLPPEVEQWVMEERERIDFGCEVVATYGEHPTTETTITHWIYFRRRKDALAFAEAARRPDRFIEVTKSDERQWQVVIEEPFYGREGEVLDRSDTIEALAEKFRGDYDGNAVGPLGEEKTDQ